MSLRRPELLWGGLLGVMLLLAVWWIPGDSRGETDSFSHGFAGKSVFFELVSKLEGDTFRSVEELAPYGRDYGRLAVVGPARYPTADQWQVLREDVLDYEASLLFAASAADPAVRAEVFGVSVEPVASLFGDEDDDGPSRNPFDEPPEAQTDLVEELVPWRSSGVLEFSNPERWEVLVSTDDGPQVARRRYPNATVVFSASDEVFSNAALADPAQARLAYRLFEACETDYFVTCFDESLNQSGTPKVLGVLFEPTLRPLTLQALLLLVLFGWTGARRFGPIRQQHDGERRSIEEHAEALGTLYYQGRAGDHAVQSMADFVSHELVRRNGIPLHHDSAEEIARMSQLQTDDVRLLVNDIHSAKNRVMKNTQASLLVTKLAEILASMQSYRPGK